MLKNNFCSSPWFHLKINPAGYYVSCRWDIPGTVSNFHIATTSLIEYMNTDMMRQLRVELLNGQSPTICKSCRYEDSLNKLSGRQRQLLKSGIQVEHFIKTFCSSLHWEHFQYSYENQGYTLNSPIDLQIDLGNTCNSACIMCPPMYSSRLAKDYKKLHELQPLLFNLPNNYSNWSDNPDLIEKFINDLDKIPNVQYIHFLGGETLYLKSFYDICNKLIDNGSAENISLGTTTNCTVYTLELENIIRKVKQFHLGLSIESVLPLNDYIRYPSKIHIVLDNINKFLALRETTNLHLSLRITPNILSIYHIDTIFEFMIKHSITAESCNVLQDPSCLRLELLPKEIIKKIINKIDKLIDKYKLTPNNQIISNRRRDDLIDLVIVDIIFEYKHLLETYQEPENIEQERYNLIKFLKAFESIRNNNIIEYLPEYEEFLRSYGY
jgi:hypothetical protein